MIDDKTFVYLDPPYRPIATTASFTHYTEQGFDDTKQLELANFFRRLDHERGAKLMLLNLDPNNAVDRKGDFLIKAFAGYNIYRVLAPRAINSKGELRGKISELVITNYKHEPPILAIYF
ncbi:MAG: DNA adenine methylase [Bacteroidia bacterium]|nr:DNA adenine methylase [Bacteroidia bacterium]MDW8157960.1 DNA adenine methylase [Bacteroidia bacterium]